MKIWNGTPRINPYWYKVSVMRFRSGLDADEFVMLMSGGCPTEGRWKWLYGSGLTEAEKAFVDASVNQRCRGGRISIPGRAS